MTFNFRALKPITVGENELWIGDVFVMPDDRDWQAIVKLGLAELVEEKEGEEIPPSIAENDLTNTSDNAIMPEIVKEAYEVRKVGTAWFGIFKDGEQVGKSFRTKEQANEEISNRFA